MPCVLNVCTDVDFRRDEIIHSLNGATKDEVEQYKVDSFIVDRLAEGLHMNQQCRTEEQRQDYHVGLAYVVPPPAA